MRGWLDEVAVVMDGIALIHFIHGSHSSRNQKTLKSHERNIQIIAVI